MPISGGNARRIARASERVSPFTWSRDGQRVAYHDGEGVWISDMTTGIREPLRASAAPAFSPDGTRIAYVDEGRLYVANVDGSHPTRLAKTLADIHGVSWSPDASHLVFSVGEASYSQSGELHTIAADGQNLRDLHVQGHSASWSPFPARRGSPSLSVVSPEPGGPAVLPDGAVTATVRVRLANHAHGWNWRVDEPFPASGMAGGHHVSRGSEAAIGPLTPGEENAVYVALVDGAGAMLSPPVVRVVSVRARPAAREPARVDDTRIASVSWRTGIRIVNADGRADHTVRTDATIARVGRIRWSPDGRAAFAASTVQSLGAGVGPGRLFVTNAQADFARPTGDAVGVAHPDWSPDGSHIVYTAGGHIEISTPEGAERRVIAPASEISRPRYSSDGSSVAFLVFDRPRTTLQVVQTTGAGLRAVAPGLAQVDAFAWDPTSDRIAVGSPGLIYVLADADAKPRFVRAGRLMSWSTDGRWLAYIGPHGGLALHDVDTGASRLMLKPDHERHVVATAWAPDGSRLAYTAAPHASSDHGALHVVTLATGLEDRRVYGGAGNLSWGPGAPATASRLSISRPRHGDVFPARTTEVELEAHLDAAWRWRRNGYFPASGEAGGRPGSDEPIPSGGLKPGRVYTIRVAAVDIDGVLLYPRDVTSVTFTVTIPADANADGIVDLLDLVYVGTNFGRWGDFADGEPDVDGDGFVRIQDLMAVAARFGDRIAPSAPAAPRRPRADDAASLEQWTRRAEGVATDTQELRDGLATLRALLASVAPSATALLPNYPNPFNPETWIPFDLAGASTVTITLYDMRGRRVRTLDLGAKAAGRYRSRAQAPRWDGRNELGENVGGGVYVAELRAGNHVERRRLSLVK